MGGGGVRLKDGLKSKFCWQNMKHTGHFFFLNMTHIFINRNYILWVVSLLYRKSSMVVALHRQATICLHIAVYIVLPLSSHLVCLSCLKLDMRQNYQHKTGFFPFCNNQIPSFGVLHSNFLTFPDWKRKNLFSKFSVIYRTAVTLYLSAKNLISPSPSWAEVQNFK